MHRLHLLRHAKSGYPRDTEDRGRPLTRRGREAAQLVGRSLPQALGAIDLVLCSDALRTRETAELALAGYQPPPRTVFENGLYLAGAKALLRRLQALDEHDYCVLLVGHNPGIHELAVALAAPGSAHYRGLAAGKFPTAARASFAVSGAWSEIARGGHELIDYVTAKSLAG